MAGAKKSQSSSRRKKSSSAATAKKQIRNVGIAKVVTAKTADIFSVK